MKEESKYLSNGEHLFIPFIKILLKYSLISTNREINRYSFVSFGSQYSCLLEIASKVMHLEGQVAFIEVNTVMVLFENFLEIIIFKNNTPDSFFSYLNCRMIIFSCITMNTYLGNLGNRNWS